MDITNGPAFFLHAALIKDIVPFRISGDCMSSSWPSSGRGGGLLTNRRCIRTTHEARRRRPTVRQKHSGQCSNATEIKLLPAFSAGAHRNEERTRKTADFTVLRNSWAGSVEIAGVAAATSASSAALYRGVGPIPAICVSNLPSCSW